MKKLIKRIIIGVNKIRFGTVIMAHHVCDDGHSDKNSITRADLQEFLDINKNRILSLKALSGSKNKRNKFALTVDDGYEDVYTTIYPLCLSRGVPFTVFIIVDKIENDGYLTSDEISEMIRSGLVTIGSHGLTHEILTNKNVDLLKEVSYTKDFLEKKFNVPVDYFAYSHGQFNNVTVKAVCDAGYKKSFAASYISSSEKVLPRFNITMFV